MIKHIKCDIFESGADVILHQVNCQGVMGSGIAKQVREKYPEVYQHYVSECKKYSPEEIVLAEPEAMVVSTTISCPRLSHAVPFQA